MTSEPAGRLCAVGQVAGAAAFVVDLGERHIVHPDGQLIGFDINESEREALMLGLDDIGLTGRHLRDIEQWESAARQHLAMLQALRIMPDEPA